MKTLLLCAVSVLAANGQFLAMDQKMGVYRGSSALVFRPPTPTWFTQSPDPTQYLRDGYWVPYPSYPQPSELQTLSVGFTGGIPVVGSWPGTAPANCGRPVYPAWRNAQLAVYDPAAFVWYFDTNGDGHINTMPFNGVYDAAPISYGFAGGIPVAGSWDGMASDGIGIFKDGVWYLRHSDGTTETRFFGAAGDKPFVVPVVVGTSAVIAVYRPSTHMVYLAIPDGSGNGFTAVDPFAGMAPPAWLSWPGSDPRPSALMNSTGGWGYAIFDRAIGWWTFGAANPARPNGVSLGVAGDYEMVGMNPCYGERIPN